MIFVEDQCCCQSVTDTVDKAGSGRAAMALRRGALAAGTRTVRGRHAAARRSMAARERAWMQGGQGGGRVDGWRFAATGVQKAAGEKGRPTGHRATTPHSMMKFTACDVPHCLIHTAAVLSQ